jgi:hypothetical protein
VVPYEGMRRREEDPAEDPALLLVPGVLRQTAQEHMRLNHRAQPRGRVLSSAASRSRLLARLLNLLLKVPFAKARAPLCSPAC